MRKLKTHENPVPEDLLVNGIAEALNYWLSLFVNEDKKEGWLQVFLLNLLLAGLK